MFHNKSFWFGAGSHRNSVTRAKSPNAYKKLPKTDFTRKLKIYKKLPKNVVDFGKYIVATGFEKLPKVQ